MKSKLSRSFFFFFSFLAIGQNVLAKAAPCIITGPVLACTNQSANYQVDVSNTGYTYQWIITGGSLLSQTNNTCAVEWTVSGAGTIAVNITQNGTLINSCSLAVNVYNTPSPYIIPSFEATCYEDEDPGGEQHSLNAVLPRPKEDPCSKVCENSTVVYRTPNHPGSTYAWVINGLNYSFAGGQNTNVFTVTWGTVSSGTIQVTETNAAGCSKTVYKCLQIIKTPTAGFTTTPGHNGVSVTICKNQTVSFKDISVATSNSAIVSWVWDFGDGTGTATYTAGATVTHQYTNGGNSYTATLTVKNACGCENTYSIKVIVQKFDVPTLICPSTVCCGKPTKYEIRHAADEDFGCGYTWSVTGGILLVPNPGQTSDNAIVTWDCSATPKTIKLTPVGCNHCDNPIIYDVSVITTSSNINGNTIVCPNSEETYSIPAMPGCNFVWALSDPSAGEIFAGAETNSVKVRWSAGFSGVVTLSVTYTNTVFGCGGTGQLDIILRPTFDIIANPAGSVCAGNPVTFTAVNQFGGLVNTSWQINQLPSGTNIFTVNAPVSSISYTFTSGGDYEIVATDNAATTCNSPVKLIKTITGIPPVHTGTVSGQVSNICPGQSYMYTATPTSSDYILVWNALPNGIVTPVSGNKVNIVWSASGQINLYQVTKTNPACSSLVRIITVQTVAPPSCIITSSSGNFNPCPNGTFTYSVAAGYNNYAWVINPSSAGSIIGGQGSASVTVQWHNTSTPVIANLAVAIRYCAQAIKNCTSTAITISAVPPISIVPSNASVCPNTSQTFTITGITSASLVTWNWGDGTTTSTTTLSTSHSYSTTGTYNITAVVQQPNGCNTATSTASTTVNVLSQPTVVISLGGSGATVRCPADPATTPPALLIATILTGPCSATPSYQWYKNGVAIAPPLGIASSYQPSWPALGGTDSYYFIYTCPSAPCGSVQSPVVLIRRPLTCPTCTLAGNPNPTISWSHTSAVACGAGTVTYNVPAPGIPVKINFGDGSPDITISSSSGSLSKTYTRAGIYYPTLFTRYPSTTPPTLCDVNKSVQVIIPVIANITLSAVCNAGGGYNIVVTDISDKLATYNTTLRQCKLDAGAFQTMASNIFTFTGIAAGNHTVTFQITVTQGANTYTCAITKPVLLPVLTTPVINIAPGIPRCVGAPVALSTNATNAAGYVWQFGDGTSSLLAAPTHEYKTSFSPVTISVQITTNQGCVVTGSTTLNVIANNLGVTITSPSGASPLAICQGSTSPVLNSNVTGATGAVSYVWNTSLLNNISSNSSIVASNQVSNLYNVTVADAIGCLRTSAPFEVIIKPTPIASIIGRDEYCNGETVSLSAEQGAGYTYQWTVNGINAGTNPFISFTNYNIGNNTVTLVVSAAGCSASTTITVKINSNPFVYVLPGINSQLCAGQPNLITANVSGGTAPYAYYWNTVPVQTTPSITVTNAGLYQATVIDINGCVGKDITRVYRVEDFTNFMSGCYEICADKKIELVGPKSPSIANSPLPPYGIPYLITYSYQWYKDGNAIPPPDGTNANYWVDPAPGPYSGSGQYTLSITSTLPSAGCEKNSLNDYQKSFNVTFKECCKVDLKILNIVCVRGSYDPVKYVVVLQVYNPYPNSATITLHSPNGPVYTVPTQGNLPNPGWNTITAYFVDWVGSSTELCIDGGTITDDKSHESCDFETKICAELPRCINLCSRANPCECFASDPNPSLKCSSVHPPPGYVYAYDFQVSFVWGCRTTAQVVVYSDCGDFGPITPGTITQGFNNLSGAFYTNQPPGTVCEFLILLIDPETGQEICHFCVSLRLNCERGFAAVNSITGIDEKPGTAGIAINTVKPKAAGNKIQSGKNDEAVYPKLNQGITLVPNPASGFTKLNYKFKNDADNRIVIYNMMGEPVKTYTGLSQTGILNIDVGLLAVGTYIVKGFGKEEILVAKLVVIR